MWKLRRFLKPYRKQVVLGPLFKFIEAVLELMVPVVMAAIIDKGVAAGDRDFILRNGMLLVLLGAVGLGCASVCQYFASKASQGVGTDLRHALFAHVLTLSPADLDRLGENRLATAITGDTTQLQTAVAMLIRLVVRAPFIVIGAFAASFMIDAQLSLIMLAVIPVLALLIWLVMSRTVPFYKKLRASLDRVALITGENLASARVVRAFNSQEREKKRFREASDVLSETVVGGARLSSLLNPLTYVVVNLGIAAIIWAGGFHVDSGRLTQGELVAFVNYMTQINTALVVVANLVVTFTRAAASAERVNGILETIPSVENGTLDPFEGECETAVEFKNVTFGYGGEPALENINLKIPRGCFFGIVGGTGAGKSTLVKLIARFYDPDAGSVLVNGVDLRGCDGAALRRRLAYVSQDTKILSGDVESNVRMGREWLTGGDIISALKGAQADFALDSPEGISKTVGEGGNGLSGGQKQRLAIARGLAGNPDILILDDSAGGLDASTSKKLFEVIASLQSTRIVVTQRPSSVRNADIIAVMDDGRLAGIGSREQLLRSCELYRDIASD